MISENEGNERKDILILIGVILFTLFIVYVVSIYMQSGEFIAKVKNLNPDKISSIIISPRNLGNFKRNLLDHSIEIKDKKSIGLICDSLARANSFNQIHPVSDWYCVITINSKSDKIKFIVSKSNEKNGVLVYLYSYGTWGFALGDLRTDSLGDVLELIVKSKT